MPWGQASRSSSGRPGRRGRRGAVIVGTGAPGGSWVEASAQLSEQLYAETVREAAGAVNGPSVTGNGGGTGSPHSREQAYTRAMPPVVAVSRQEQKLRTRRALLDAALRLLEHQSFDGLGLREVAREAGLSPAGFYRHFADLEELGLVLVEESFGSLREMIRSARADPDTYVHVVRSSAEILVRTVQQDRAHFRFIARERYSGVTALRQAIRGEIRLFASELATDLAHFPYLARLEHRRPRAHRPPHRHRHGGHRRGRPRRPARPARRRGRPGPRRRDAAPHDHGGGARLAQRRGGSALPPVVTSARCGRPPRLRLSRTGLSTPRGSARTLGHGLSRAHPRG